MEPEQSTPGAKPKTPAKRPRWLLLAGVCSGVLIVAGLGVYVARGRIAATWAQGYLKEQGVESELDMNQLGLSGLSGRLRIGPRDNPDLTVEHVEVDFDRSPGAPVGKVLAVRLSGVLLRVKLVNGKPVIGQLQPLIDKFSKPKAGGGGGPTPDVTLTDGHIVLENGGHTTRIALDGQFTGGHLQTLSVTTGQGVEVIGPVTADIKSAHLDLQRRGAGYDADFDAALRGARMAGDTPADITDATVSIKGKIPDPTAKALSGPVQLNGVISATGLRSSSAQGREVQLTLAVDGVASGDLAHPGLTGALDMALKAAGLGYGADTLSDAVLTAKVSGARLAGLGKDMTASGHVSGDLQARTGAVQIGAATSQITAARVRLDGPLQYASTGLTGTFAASASGRSQMSARDAERMAKATPVFGTDPAIHKALATAFVSQKLDAANFAITLKPGATTVALASPIQLSANGGGVLTVSTGAQPLLQASKGTAAGAFAVALDKGGLPQISLGVRQYSFGGGKGAADFDLGGRFDYGVFREIAFQTPAHLSLANGNTTVALPGCTPLHMAAVAGKPADLVQKIVAQLCPLPNTPLLALAGKSWRLKATARDGEAELPTSEARASNIAADIDFYGAADGPAGGAQVTRATITDAAAVSRFKPMTAKGRADLAKGRWTGRFEVAEARRGLPLAVATLTHDIARQVGSADITAEKIVFSPKGLQPGDLSYSASQMIWRATGEATFAGHYAWKADSPVVSTGHATVHFSDFRMGAGEGTGLKTELTFTSLGPMATPPDQVATVDKIESVTPLTGIEVHYSLTPTTLEVASAVVLAGAGRVTLDPISLLLKPKSSAKGQLKVVNVDIGSILSSTDIADSVSLKAVVAGVVPFTMTPDGLRVANGRLVSVGPGRLSIKRQVLAGGAAVQPGAAAQPGTVKDIAYQALENLAFDELDGVLESRPNGRLGMILHIRGRHDPDKALPSQINMIDVLRGKMADTPINLPKGTPVNLTLDTSINFDDLMESLSKPEFNPRAQSAPQKP